MTKLGGQNVPVEITRTGKCLSHSPDRFGLLSDCFVISRAGVQVPSVALFVPQHLHNSFFCSSGRSQVYTYFSLGKHLSFNSHNAGTHSGQVRVATDGDGCDRIAITRAKSRSFTCVSILCPMSIKAERARKRGETRSAFSIVVTKNTSRPCYRVLKGSALCENFSSLFIGIPLDLGAAKPGVYQAVASGENISSTRRGVNSRKGVPYAASRRGEKSQSARRQAASSVGEKHLGDVPLNIPRVSGISWKDEIGVALCWRDEPSEYSSGGGVVTPAVWLKNLTVSSGGIGRRYVAVETERDRTILPRGYSAATNEARKRGQSDCTDSCGVQIPASTPQLPLPEASSSRLRRRGDIWAAMVSTPAVATPGNAGSIPAPSIIAIHAAPCAPILVDVLLMQTSLRDFTNTLLRGVAQITPSRGGAATLPCARPNRRLAPSSDNSKPWRYDMSEHTKEPWSGAPDWPSIVNTETAEFVGEFRLTPDRDRACTCVNACAGIENPEAIPQVIEAARIVATDHHHFDPSPDGDVCNICGNYRDHRFHYRKGESNAKNIEHLILTLAALKGAKP